VDLKRLVHSLCCQFPCVSSAAIIARHWIEARGRGRDYTIMMRTTFLAPLHFILEIHIVLQHSSSFWSCVLARDVAAISTHLRLFCVAGLLPARVLQRRAVARLEGQESRQRRDRGGSGQSVGPALSRRHCDFATRYVSLSQCRSPEFHDACLGQEYCQWGGFLFAEMS
jgi:hypothetical protein